MYDQLTISFGQWDYRLFAPEIESYCDILLNRIDPIFADVDAEQERAAEQFMNAAASWYGDDYQGAAEAAYDHARDTALQFMEVPMRFGIGPRFRASTNVDSPPPPPGDAAKGELHVVPRCTCHLSRSCRVVDGDQSSRCTSPNFSFYFMQIFPRNIY